jgi:hypothetical protein
MHTRYTTRISETYDKTELQQSLKRIITNDKATLWEKPMRRDAIMNFNNIIRIPEQPPGAR